ncbi:MAG: PEP/pyruvate-binding domain-containing protein, partial [archaeon]|nr:PEP/pyruvate-binding domain-containing protein [archaeon]
MRMEFVLDMNALSAGDVEKVGEKAFTLSQLANAGVSVPEGFVVINAGLHFFLKENNIAGEVEELQNNISGMDFETLAR